MTFYSKQSWRFLFRFDSIKVTIVRSGNFLGHTLLDHGKKTIWTLKEKEVLLTLLLAGKASEVYFLKEASSLGEDDFAKVKQIANSLVKFFVFEFLLIFSFHNKCCPIIFLGLLKIVPTQRKRTRIEKSSIYVINAMTMRII